MLSRNGGAVNGQLPITLKSTNRQQVKAWLDEFHSCRQLSREELADEPDPEFEVTAELTEKVERMTARRQSSAETAEVMTPAEPSTPATGTTEAVSSRQESIVDDDRIEVETIGSDSVPTTPTTPTTTLSQAKASKDRDHSDHPLKRTPSRDLPEGLPKPIKSSDSSKRNSLSRQTSSQADTNRRSGERTPDTGLSRRNSNSDKAPTTGSGSRLSSRKSSINSDKNAESLSRRSSVKQSGETPGTEESATTKSVLSRRGSSKVGTSTPPTDAASHSPSDAPIEMESEIAENVRMYEKTKTVLVDDDAVEQDVGRTGARRTSRQMSNPLPKPKVKRELQDCQVAVEDMAKFECELTEECAPTATVEWLRDGKVLNLAGRYRAFSEGPLHVLQISRVIDEDAGQFCALITSPSGQVQSTARLFIKPDSVDDLRPCTPGGSLLPCAPVFKIRLKDTTLLLGSRVRFELLVYAQPLATVIFSKDGVPLRENDRVKVKRKTGESFELIIDQIQPTDAGSYSVRAYNDHGEDHTSCVLSITRKFIFI